jgi:transcription termination factor Rho
MTERRRPHRRGRGARPTNRPPLDVDEGNPYRDAPTDVAVESGPPNGAEGRGTAEPGGAARSPDVVGGARIDGDGASGESGGGREAAARQPNQPRQPRPQGQPRGGQPGGQPRGERGNQRDVREVREPRDGGERNGRNNRRRNRGRAAPGREPQGERGGSSIPIQQIVADTELAGWFDAGRDGSGFVRKASASYLAEPGDPFVPMSVVRDFGLRRGDAIKASAGRDSRGRLTVVNVSDINGVDPAVLERRPDFGSLTPVYPERKLTLETGRPAKGGPELTRRAIDLVAPIGYGQRALIVAPARAGKTMLLQAIVEGVAVNHPEAALLILLVDERPEEVSDMITWGYGEVVASSFDMPAQRHVDVADIVLERARRLVEMGKDVVIVLDSITRLARSHNTAERGTGRTMSGGLDSTAMAKPKAFFGSARSVAESAGGGSLTIIATALVETGSRMDDVIFEEFKGTGNCEIKLDRSLAERRIFPAIDIGTSGTRREEKLFRPDQLDAVFTLRRGLHQMPSQAAMEWLIKRIANTTGNDALLAGL